MKKKLIATDFDGTFMRGKTADPADLEAIAAYRRAGGCFGFVTGRDAEFFDILREIGMDVDYLLLYNGAMLALPDGTVVKEYLIARDVFAAIADFFASLGDAVYRNEPDERLFYHQYYGGFDTAERALEVASQVNARFGDAVTAVVNGGHVNIGKKGSGKAQGVYDALRYFGLPDDAAAVFGDDYNDIDMLATHRGWAVDTARKEVIAAASHVCRSVGAAALTLLDE